MKNNTIYSALTNNIPVYLSNTGTNSSYFLINGSPEDLRKNIVFFIKTCEPKFREELAEIAFNGGWEKIVFEEFEQSMEYFSNRNLIIFDFDNKQTETVEFKPNVVIPTKNKVDSISPENFYNITNNLTNITKENLFKYLLSNQSFIKPSCITNDCVHDIKIKLSDGIKEKIDLNSVIDPTLLEFINSTIGEIGQKYNFEPMAIMVIELNESLDISEKASNEEIKNIIFNVLDNNSILLLHGLTTNEFTSEYEDSMRFTVFNHIKNNRQKTLPGKIILGTYFNESKTVELPEIVDILENYDQVIDVLENKSSIIIRKINESIIKFSNKGNIYETKTYSI
jgi:hypothetical protein